MFSPRAVSTRTRSRRIALTLLAALAACATRGKDYTPAAPTPAPALPAKQSTELEPFTLAHLAEGAKLLDDLGKTGREVTTRSPEAQAFFNQGLALVYGFNHDEAARSFARAAQLDPSCALCFWGAAYCARPELQHPSLARPRAGGLGRAGRSAGAPGRDPPA